jgi:LacI family transcriptional regulator
MSPLRHVLLIIETSKVYGRGLLDGIGRYAMAHGQWSLHVDERGLDEEPARLLRNWKGDGIIFRSTNRAMVQAIRRKGVPAVDTNSAVIGHGFPLVYADENRIAQLAVTHFLERHFEHFAFCSVDQPRWVQWRREAYLRELSRLGLSAHVFPAVKPDQRNEEQQYRRLAAWVAELPRPIGVLAANDVCGTRVIAACREAGVRIPEQVAVLGVDNDEVLCRLASPPLSSIDPDSPTIGYRAAALLDDLMCSGATGTEPIWVPAHGVVTRQSTDTLAIPDEDLARAMGFIRERACTGISVEDVVESVGVSRATLERKFSAHLQTTPRQAILRAQMERVKWLLAETNYSLEEIAERTGYKSQSHLSVAFKREFGRTPGEYRAEACCGACTRDGQSPVKFGVRREACARDRGALRHLPSNE